MENMNPAGVLPYQRRNLGPLCWKCNHPLDEAPAGTCPQCGRAFDLSHKYSVNWGRPVGPFRKLALTPFGWGMHVCTLVLAVIVLVPPWVFGEVLGLFVMPWLFLLVPLIWLVRFFVYLAVGLASRYPWQLLFRPWKCTLIFPIVFAVLVTAELNYFDLTLYITVALHQNQLNHLAANIQAGKTLEGQSMWVYSLDADESVGGCPTLRIPESDEILVYHVGGPPPPAEYPFRHIWGNWYEYLHY
jgi:hypothetical protein